MMSAYTTIARPYAKAAFEFSLENAQTKKWLLFLERMSLMISDKALQAFLTNPQIPKEKKESLLIDLAGIDASKEQKNYLMTLSVYNRFLCLPAIADIFDKLLKEKNNSVDVEITSAFTLTELQQQKLQKALNIRLGKEIVMTVNEDKGLIGGAMIRAGDFVIDGTTLGKLQRLRKQLMR